MSPSLGSVQFRARARGDTQAAMTKHDFQHVAELVSQATRERDDEFVRKLLPAMLSVSHGVQMYVEQAFRSTRLSGDSHQRLGSRLYGELERCRQQVPKVGRAAAATMARVAHDEATEIACRRLQAIGDARASLRVEFSMAGPGLLMGLAMALGLEDGHASLVDAMAEGTSTVRAPFFDTVAAMVQREVGHAVTRDLEEAVRGAMATAASIEIQGYGGRAGVGRFGCSAGGRRESCAC